MPMVKAEIGLGTDVLKMHTFRQLREQCLNPWNYDRALDYAAERIFLWKLGGHIFIHRLPLEHFAKMASVQEPVDGAGPNWKPRLWMMALRIAPDTSDSKAWDPEPGELARLP